MLMADVRKVQLSTGESVIMVVQSVALLLLIAGTVLLVSADPNPACMKLPDVKGLKGSRSCCTFPRLAELKSMEECWKEITSKKEPEMVKLCKPLQCMFKRFNVLKANDTLDRTAAERYLDNRLKNSTEWLKLTKSILLDQCMPMVERDYAKMVQFFRTNRMELPEPSQCSLKPMFVVICFSAMAFAKCPASSSSQSPICDEWKKYTNTCTGNAEDILQTFKLLDRMPTGGNKTQPRTTEQPKLTTGRNLTTT
ncbi:general odorant-binding protein 68-like [Aedes albopictus]|uniref:OBP47-like domain-containing protein n=1 Tax=Aedes albopictus TaxID=7160 RepID=A0ABM1XTN2_AEDAL|nr:general odorant-binding protein 68-like [Aedes albopictus]